MLTEISQTEKENTVIIYMWDIKNKTYVYNKTNSQMWRTNQWLPIERGKEGEGQDTGTELRDINYQL